MRNRIILACGLALSLLGQAIGQEAALPANSFSPFPDDEANGYAMLEPSSVFTQPSRDRWITADFLFGWIEGGHLSPLVTTTNAADVDQSVAGVLGEDTTDILLQGTVNKNVVPGFQFGAGYLYDPENGHGIEAGFAFLGSQSSRFFFSSDQFPVLAVPFFNADTDEPASTLVAFTSTSTGVTQTGNVAVEAKTGNFYSVNLDLTERVWEDENQRLDVLFGYRFAYLNDSLRIHSQISPVGTGATVDTFDDFAAKNSFHGLDLGVRSSYTWDKLTLNLLAKFSPGRMHRTVTIRGRTASTSAGVPPPGGMFAEPTNIGEHESNKWTLLPELATNATWQWTPNVAFRFGYSALFLTKVVRSDNQIDFTLSPSGAIPRPAFSPHQNTSWVQTVNLGVDVTF